MADSCLARQSTPVAGARLDRTAAHAAVRNLAESYGVDLLPLDLSHMADLDAPTPVNVNIQRRCSEPGGPPHRQLSITAELPTSPCAGIAVALAGPEVAISPRKAPAVPAGTESDISTAPDLAEAAAVDGDDVQQTWLGSSVADEFAAEADEEGEYLEYDLPLEQRISLLEEERDILVDKLLATTEALHASEARNRQNQASASQVGALLNQLQELLRRAEVERDRAKLQLKRQRVSVTQLTTEHSASAVVAGLAAAPSLAQSMSAPLQVTADQTLRGSSSSTGEGSSNSSIAVAANQPAVSEQLRHRKKHKSSSEDGILGQAALALSGTLAPHSPEVSTTAAAAGAPGTTGPGSGSSIGRRKRGSNSSTADAPASPGAEQLESPVTLTPSSNDVRPPVKSVINGFEVLMKQRARAAAAKAAAARAAAAEAAAAAAAAAAAPAGFVAAAVASREAGGGSPSKAQAVAAAAAAGKDTRVRSLAAALEPEAAAAAAAAAELAAEAAAAEAAAAQAAAAEAAASAAGADACAGLGMQVPRIRVDRVRTEDGCNGSATAVAVAGRLAGSSAGSAVSTPTAAAVCNASPAQFRAELLSLDDGMSESEVITSSEVMGPSYADVVCRTSREWSRGSSRAASTSPSPSRPVQRTAGHSCKSTPKQQQQQQHEAVAGSSSQPLQESKATTAVAASSAMAGATAGVFFSFGRSRDAGSSSSSSCSSKRGHGVSPARSPKAAASPKCAVHSPRSASAATGTKATSASRLGCSAAVAGSAASTAPNSVVAAAVAEAKLVKQQQRQGLVYNPTAFKAGDSSCSSTKSTSAGIAAANSAAAAAAAAVKPVVRDVADNEAPAAVAPAATARADAAAKPSSASDTSQQQQQSSKKTHVSCTAAKKQQQKQGQQQKQPDPPPQQQQKAQSQPQPQLKVEVGKQAPVASPTASGLGTPGSPADCTAEVVTCDSSNGSSGNTCGSGRRALHKGKKQAAGKGTLQAAGTTDIAGKGMPAAAGTATKHVNSSDRQSQIGLLWKVAVVVLLLLSGGLLATLMLTRPGAEQQQGATTTGSLDLQQELEAMQERVAVLQRQLTEKELQLATCNGWDPAAAVVDVDEVAMASYDSEL